MQDNIFINFNKDYDDLANIVIPKYEEIQSIIIDKIKNITCENKKILDLGCGIGTTIERIFSIYPDSHISGIDSSDSMLSKARGRLDKFPYKNWNLLERDIAEDAAYGNKLNTIISIMALNNINSALLPSIYQNIFDSLASNGQFIHADFIRHEQENINLKLEESYKNHLYSTIDDKKFLENWFKHSADGYYPVTLTQHFSILEKTGFRNISLHWLFGNQAIFSATKS